MPGGRPRKPHNLRVLEGKRGKSRPLEPDLPAPKDALTPPDGLSAEEQAAWEKHVGWVSALGLETSVDAGQFEAMVRLYCRARAADKVLEVGGFSQELHNSEGQVVNVAKRPEVGISLDCWRAYAQLADKFGMSATARAKLGTGEKRPETAGEVPPELRDASGG